MSSAPSGVPIAGVREGDIIAGKYRIERVLGAGGMGVVVAARHLQLDEKVALKFILPEALSNQEAVGRFLREARAAVKIKTEHVARVSDVGQLENGAPYMVMEFLEGGDLSEWLKQRGPLPVEQAVDFVLQACVAVAEAHSLGIVHRDLKPANLFCVRRADGQLTIKVLDFGISKVIDAARASEPPGVSMTRTSAFMGSPLYMSPEQMSSAKSADAQSDIWALGVILYELLAGRVPFLGEVVTEVVVQVTSRPPPPLRDFRPDAPPGLEAVIVKCLEKERATRYRNVAELALALLEFAPRRARASVERITGTIQAAGLSASALAMPPSPPVAPGTLVSGVDAVSGIAGTSPGVSHTTPSTRSRSRTTGIVLGGAFAAIAAIVAVVVLHKPPLSQPPTAVPPAVAPPPVAAAVSLPIASETAVAPPPAAVTSPAPAAPQTAITSPTSALRPHATTPASRPAGASPAAAAVAPPTPAAPPPVPPPQPVPAQPSAARSVSPTPNCDPPYTLDDQGRKKFKPECFLNK